MRTVHALGIVILGVGMAAHCREATAGASLGGRFWLTYQQARETSTQQEYFTQHYEAILRDRLFQQNDVRFTVYIDNSRNLTDNLTYRQYRGQLDVSHRYYTFNARFTPLQEANALELDASREIRQNQFTLDVHVPDTPRLRLSYGTRTQYLDAARSVDIRELRADVSHRYRSLDFRAHRWSSISRNGNEIQTDVTGASVRGARSFANWFTADGGYDFRLTESDREIGPVNRVTNHTVSGIFQGRYQRLMSATLSASTRHLSQEYIVDSKGRDDNVNFVLAFFEGGHVRPEASRTYTLNDVNGNRLKSDYASVQMLIDGNVQKRTWARAQVTRRFDIDTDGGVLPGHIYALSTRSNLRRGIDFRAELNATEHVYDSPTLDRFQTSSLFDLFLVPRQNLTVTPHLQYTRFSDQLSFLHNDRAMWGVSTTYIPRYPRMSLGADVNRTTVTTGNRRMDTAAAVNLSMSLRSRASFNVSYGVRETEYFGRRVANRPGISRTNTLNAQAQVWVVRRGSLSINYTGMDRDPERDSSQFSITYRQDF